MKIDYLNCSTNVIFRNIKVGNIFRNFPIYNSNSKSVLYIDVMISYKNGENKIVVTKFGNTKYQDWIFDEKLRCFKEVSKSPNKTFVDSWKRMFDNYREKIPGYLIRNKYPAFHIVNNLKRKNGGY